MVLTIVLCSDYCSLVHLSSMNTLIITLYIHACIHICIDVQIMQS